MYDMAWLTKTVDAPERLDVKKPNICGMIPGLLDIKETKDVLSLAALPESLLIKCISFPFTLQGFLCAHPNMHYAQTGG